MPCVVNVHLLARDQARHKLKIGVKNMKKYKVIITSAKDVKLLNDKISINSLFTVGETINNNLLHVGVNVATDKRVIDGMKELAHKRGYCTNKDWMTFDDDLCGHKYAVCCKHKDIASKQYIVDECECLEDATNDLNKWRHSGTDYSYYILDTDNNKILN